MSDEQREEEFVTPGPPDPTICPHHSELRRDIKVLSREIRRGVETLSREAREGDDAISNRVTAISDGLASIEAWANGDAVQGMRGAESRLQDNERRAEVLKEKVDGMEGQVMAIGKIADLDVKAILDTINEGVAGAVPGAVKQSTARMASDIQGKNQRFAALCALVAAVLSTLIAGGITLYAKRMDAQLIRQLQPAAVVAPSAPTRGK